MSMTTCKECGKEISTLAPACPHCGAPQNQMTNDNTENQTSGSSLSTNMILSYIALGITIIGILFGGLYMEIGAIVISIIVLKSKEEKEAVKIARIALIVSSIILGIKLVLLLLAQGYVSGFIDRILGEV